MSAERLVLNEWVLHDLAGDNGSAEQRRAFELLVKIRECSDSIAVLRGSPWMNKAFQMMKESRPSIRQISKFLHLKILRDPQICVLVDPSLIPSPDQPILRGIPREDAYLIQTYQAANATRLVTTDQPLIAALSQDPKISAWSKQICLAYYSIP